MVLAVISSFGQAALLGKETKKNNLQTRYSRNHCYSGRQLSHAIMSVKRCLKNIKFRKVFSFSLTLLLFKYVPGHYARHFPYIISSNLTTNL